LQSSVESLSKYEGGSREEETSLNDDAQRTNGIEFNETQQAYLVDGSLEQQEGAIRGQVAPSRHQEQASSFRRQRDRSQDSPLKADNKASKREKSIYKQMKIEYFNQLKDDDSDSKSLYE